MVTPQTEALTDAIAANEQQPIMAFAALQKMTEDTVGVKLFTLTVFDTGARLARRIYSNMPEAYPISGTKPIDEDSWTQHVLDEHQIFVANDISAIADVFPDFDLIRSLDCQSVINIPAVVNGTVVGTVNCLHDAGFYTSQRITAAKALMLPAAACFMLNSLLQGDQQ